MPQKQTEWKPRTTLLMIVMGVKQLLSDPNGDNPLEPEIYRELVNSRARFNDKARLETERYACAVPVVVPDPAPRPGPAAPEPARKRPRPDLSEEAPRDPQ